MPVVTQLQVMNFTAVTGIYEHVRC